jgi:cytochrome P450
MLELYVPLPTNMFYSTSKVSDRMGWTFSVVRMPYGTMWRRHRRAIHEHFHVNAVQKYIPIQTKETQAFLHRLLITPENFIHHIRQWDIFIRI